MNKIIINSDDLGLSRHANKSIFHCYDSGYLNSASLLVNGDDVEYAVEQCKERPKLQVALHVNLTEGKPISNVREIGLLVGRNGTLKLGFLTLLLRSTLLSRKYKSKMEAQIEQEIRAQFSEFSRYFPYIDNLRVDTHIHILAIPVVLKIFLKLAKEESFQIVRIPLEKSISLQSFSINGIKQLVLILLLGKSEETFKRFNVEVISSVVGVKNSGKMHKLNRKQISTAISTNKNKRIEFIFHPGGMSKEESSSSSFRYFDFYLSKNRKRESDFLTATENPFTSVH